MWSTGRSTDEKCRWLTSELTSTRLPNNGGVHRSQSLGAGDSVVMPPSHRRHRMQYLANRSLFERNAPSEPPPLPPAVTRQPPCKQPITGFRQFAAVLLNEQEYTFMVDGSLPPLQIVEEPLCTKTRVSLCQSSVVDSIDEWQPKWLKDEYKTYGTDGERIAAKARVQRSSSDVGYRNGSKASSMLVSSTEHGLQDLPSHTFHTRNKVRDIAKAYQAAREEKSRALPVLGRRSSTSAVPVKVLARRFSIPNE